MTAFLWPDRPPSELFLDPSANALRLLDYVVDVAERLFDFRGVGHADCEAKDAPVTLLSDLQLFIRGLDVAPLSAELKAARSLRRVDDGGGVSAEFDLPLDY